MAQRVVDLLEAVEVEIEQGQPPPGARRDGQGLDQAVLEQAAVGQAGQRVVVGQMLDAVAQFLGAGEQAPGVADLAPEQEHQDAGAAEQAAQRQPADRAQLAQVLLQHCCATRPSAAGARASAAAGRPGRRRDRRDRACERGWVRRALERAARGAAASPAGGPAAPGRRAARGKGRESLPERSTSSRLQNRSKRVRSAAESPRRRRGAVEAVQQPLELEARLEHAPARFGGAVRRRCGSGAAGDARSGAGWRRTRRMATISSAAPDQPRAAAGAHATSIAVSCQIERWRWMRSSSSGCWLQG